MPTEGNKFKRTNTHLQTLKELQYKTESASEECYKKKLIKKSRQDGDFDQEGGG